MLGNVALMKQVPMVEPLDFFHECMVDDSISESFDDCSCDVKLVVQDVPAEFSAIHWSNFFKS